MKITLEEIPSLPPECDGQTLTFSFDYYAPAFGDWDHPDEVEHVDAYEVVNSEGEDFTPLLNTHKQYIDGYILTTLKECQEFDVEL